MTIHIFLVCIYEPNRYTRNVSCLPALLTGARFPARARGSSGNLAGRCIDRVGRQGGGQLKDLRGSWEACGKLGGRRTDFVEVPAVPSERPHAPHTSAHVCVPTPYKNIFLKVRFRHAKQCTATTGPTDVGGYIRGRVVGRHESVGKPLGSA